MVSCVKNLSKTSDHFTKFVTETGCKKFCFYRTVTAAYALHRVASSESVI